MEIEKAVEDTDAVIVCLSNSSVNKDGYVQKELRFVLDIADEKMEETIFVIPLRLNDCLIPRRLKKWQYVDYFPADRRKWAYGKLLNSLTPKKEKSLQSVFPTPTNKPIMIENKTNRASDPDFTNIIAIILVFALLFVTSIVFLMLWEYGDYFLQLFGG